MPNGSKNGTAGKTGPKHRKDFEMTQSLQFPPDHDMSEWTYYADKNAFMELVGPFWERKRDECYEYAFIGREKHCNLSGVVHGGALTAYADHALGRTGWIDNGVSPVVTVELSVQFMDAAQINQLIVCRVEILRKTRTMYFIRGDMRAGERLVASASGIWKIIDRPRTPDAGVR